MVISYVTPLATIGINELFVAAVKEGNNDIGKSCPIGSSM
jgi:hypothetical protein